jgi:hypothetical protein
MDWGAIGSIATAVAVLIGVWQVRLASKASRTAFEDALSREYRDIARTIPMEAHLNTLLENDAQLAALPALFQYFDLSNQQVFLRMAGRIGSTTWNEWRDGIRFNLSRRAFAVAWEHIKAQDSTTFNELRRAESEDFKTDPRKWHSVWRRFNSAISS